jgi:NADP-dependent 3-hydroxy acid dehydrogenase YdfG
VLDTRRLERIRSTAYELIGSGGKAFVIPTGVTHYDQVKKLVDAAVQTYRRINVMINNAGLMPHSPLEHLKIDEWNPTIEVNIESVRTRKRAIPESC